MAIGERTPQQPSFHQRVERMLDNMREIATKVEQARLTLGTPQGPQELNLDNTTSPTQALELGAVIAYEQKLFSLQKEKCCQIQLLVWSKPLPHLLNLKL